MVSICDFKSCALDAKFLVIYTIRERNEILSCACCTNHMLELINTRTSKGDFGYIGVHRL